MTADRAAASPALHWWADPARHAYRAADPERPEDGCASCGYLAGMHPASTAVDADRLRDALRVHHPIMRSETGPFSGCRCGQVKLGQDVIAHVVAHLRRALDGVR